MYIELNQTGYKYYSQSGWIQDFITGGQNIAVPDL